MNYMDEARFAFVHLRERKRQTFLTALGVAVGSAMLVTTISVAKGSSANVIAKVIDTSPHVLVKAERVVPLVPDNLVDRSAGMVAMITKNVTPEKKDVIK
ncbi:MAG: ABC transporter permease, partial [Chlorobiaceae bacterium]|nr:ABC transporter permease [Chlorobiaceae bacterium]